MAEITREKLLSLETEIVKQKDTYLAGANQMEGALNAIRHLLAFVDTEESGKVVSIKDRDQD